MVYLAYNKFGELGRNADWRVFQFGEQGYIECTLLHNTRDYNQYWRILNLPIEAKIAKLPN